jgi:hypothetical protein
LHIFIDEAGTFIQPKKNLSNVSTVGALIIPEKDIESIFQDFLALKEKWGYKDNEIKGSKLNEQQISDVISIVSKYDVMFEIVCIDMLTQNDQLITLHKMNQAKMMVHRITEKFNPVLVENLYKTKQEIEKLPHKNCS